MEPSRIVLPVTGSLVIGALALTESFALLPAAFAAYASAWWVLGIGRDTPAGVGE
jgi:hypothetical protein